MQAKNLPLGAWGLNILGWIATAWEWWVKHPDDQKAIIALFTIISFTLASAASLRALLRRERRKAEQKDTP